MEFECQGITEVSKNSNSVEISHSKDTISEVSNTTLGFHSKEGFSIAESSKKSPANEVLPNFRRSITDLPPALISEIFNCLDPKELGIVSCVSTALNRLASENQVWKEVYCERWGLPLVPAPLGATVQDEKSWKELFVEREFRSRTFLGRFSIDVLYGHTEAVRTVFVLASAKLIFTSGYDCIVRMWDLEDGLSITSSRPLGCTIRAVAADTKLLVAGGTDGFIQGWKAVEGLPHLFNLKGVTEFKLWDHEGPITSLALDHTRIYSGSWDMTVRVWDRSTLKCSNVLRHSDWVWALVPHDTTVATSSGSDVYLWDTRSGTLITAVRNAHLGNTYSLARSHTGDFLFTGGEDGSIHMFEIVGRKSSKIATWAPHSGPVYSLAFEFPWLVSSSSDGRLSLIDVRKLLRTSRRSLGRKTAARVSNDGVEPPQRMLHGFGPDLFSVDVGADRIVCGGEEGVVRVWNFSRALEVERRARALRGIRLENRMRRRKLMADVGDRCSVAAKNSMRGDKRGISGKLKA